MAKIPSIALIPSGYKATKIYSVLPVDGSADLTFNRGTSDDQTRVNKDGLIEDVDLDVPRLDYLDGGCPSLLLEPASTNIITYSEDFSNVFWTHTGTIGSSVLSPSGAVNAQSIDFNTAASSGRIFVSGLTPLSGSLSFFFKYKDLDEVMIYIRGIDKGSYFNLQSREFTGVAVGGGIDESKVEIKDFGNDWYRFEYSHGSAALNGIEIFCSDNQNYSTPTISGGFYLWGMQIESSNYTTSYIPTSGSTETRDAETATKTGLSSYINSTEGVLYAEISALADSGGNRMIVLSDGTAADCVVLYYTGVSNQIRFIYSVASALSCSLTYTIPSVLDYHKVALKYKEDDFALYVDGLLVDTDTSGSVLTSGTLTELSFKRADGFPFYGKTKNLRVYNEALSDLELATLTGFGSFAEMKTYLSYS